MFEILFDNVFKQRAIYLETQKFFSLFNIFCNFYITKKYKMTIREEYIINLASY